MQNKSVQAERFSNNIYFSSDKLRINLVRRITKAIAVNVSSCNIPEIKKIIKSDMFKLFISDLMKLKMLNVCVLYFISSFHAFQDSLTSFSIIHSVMMI